MAVEKITLNLIPTGETPTIHAAQFDKERAFQIELKEGEDDFSPTGYTIELQVRKVDNNIVTAIPSQVSGNIVTFLTSEQMTACSGTNLAELQISKNDMSIATLHFYLVVQRDVLAGGLSSQSEIYDLEEQIATIVPEVIGDEYYTADQVDEKIAEIPTFDPTNYYDKTQLYTKTETNGLLSQKANTSSLSTVAFTGSYDDLVDHPVIPDVSNYYTKNETYNQSEVNTLLSTKADTSSLSTVATSGSYDDLSDKPTIPGNAAVLPISASDSTNTKEYIDNKTTLVKSASGSLVHIEDGADNIPVKSLIVNIDTETAISEFKLYHEYELSSWTDISNLVKSGMAQSRLPIGAVITDKWKAQNGTEYDYPWIVMDYAEFEKQDGNTSLGMVLQAQYLDPIGMPFSGYHALLHCPSGLTAGTYHFKISDNWGNISGNTDYQFTLTQDVPNNGLVCAPNNWPDAAVANWKITTYASNTSTTALEQVALTAGNGGTDLGTFTPGYQSATMNGYQAAAYGYNRWSKSAIRQWLNSDAAAGAWWHPQTVWDMAPSKAATERGFLAGFTDDFKHILHETKIKTALNTFDKTKEGIGFEYTYDKLFLPTLEQMYINPQATGDDAEGAYWEYYKELNGTDTKFAQNGTYPELIKYDLTNHSTARYQRLRSASRGYSYRTWLVNSTGYVNYGYFHAILVLQCAPACVIF